MVVPDRAIRRFLTSSHWTPEKSSQHLPLGFPWCSRCRQQHVPWASSHLSWRNFVCPDTLINHPLVLSSHSNISILIHSSYILEPQTAHSAQGEAAKRHPRIWLAVRAHSWLIWTLPSIWTTSSPSAGLYSSLIFQTRSTPRIALTQGQNPAFLLDGFHAVSYCLEL